MKPHSGVELTPAEVEMAYHGLLHLVDSLSNYKHWLKDPNFVPLPGFETAIKQVEEETARYRQLQLRIYEACFQPVPA